MREGNVRKILLMGLPSSGKTRLTVSQLVFLPKPIIFFSELSREVLEKMDGNLDKTEVVLKTPDIEGIESLDDTEYQTIIIDHLLRVKNINSITTRNRLTEALEKSRKEWIIIAHLLKGEQNISIWSDRRMIGTVEAVDLVFGLIRNKGRDGDFLKLNILKDRYGDFLGYNALYPKKGFSVFHRF